ncbi:hypothetical protein [Streptomyces sp. NPDC004286]|uniref:hypothetical protein n=1 Tax=Streptomyces sp. NPDC004286 TaxID=3364696 RepID=UPI00369628D0
MQGAITVRPALTGGALWDTGVYPPEILLERRGGTEVIKTEPADQAARTVVAFVDGVQARSAPDTVCLCQAELLHGVRRAAHGLT